MPSRRISAAPHLAPFQEIAVNPYSGFNSDNVNMLTRIATGKKDQDFIISGLDTYGTNQVDQEISILQYPIINKSDAYTQFVFDNMWNGPGHVAQNMELTSSGFITTVAVQGAPSVRSWIIYKDAPDIKWIGKTAKIEVTISGHRPKALYISIGSETKVFDNPELGKITAYLDIIDHNTVFKPLTITIDVDQLNDYYVGVTQIDSIYYDVLLNRGLPIEPIKDPTIFDDDIPEQRLHPHKSLTVTPGVCIKDETMINITGTQFTQPDTPVIQLDYSQDSSWIKGKAFTAEDFVGSSYFYDNHGGATSVNFVDGVLEHESLDDGQIIEEDGEPVSGPRKVIGNSKESSTYRPTVKWAYICLYYSYFKHVNPNKAYIGLAREEEVDDPRYGEDYLILGKLRFIDKNTVDAILYYPRRKDWGFLDATRITYKYLNNIRHWSNHPINVSIALDYLAEEIYNIKIKGCFYFQTHQMFKDWQNDHQPCGIGHGPREYLRRIHGQYPKNDYDLLAYVCETNTFWKSRLEKTGRIDDIKIVNAGYGYQINDLISVISDRPYEPVYAKITEIDNVGRVAKIVIDNSQVGYGNRYLCDIDTKTVAADTAHGSGFEGLAIMNPVQNQYDNIIVWEEIQLKAFEVDWSNIMNSDQSWSTNSIPDEWKHNFTVNTVTIYSNEIEDYFAIDQLQIGDTVAISGINTPNWDTIGPTLDTNPFGPEIRGTVLDIIYDQVVSGPIDWDEEPSEVEPPVIDPRPRAHIIINITKREDGLAVNDDITLLKLRNSSDYVDYICSGIISQFDDSVPVSENKKVSHDYAKQRWPHEYYYVESPDETGYRKVNPFNPHGTGTVPAPTTKEIKVNRFLRADGTWKKPQGNVIVLENYYEFYQWFNSSSYKWHDGLGVGIMKQGCVKDDDYGMLIYITSDNQWYRCPQNPAEYTNSSLTPVDIWGEWSLVTPETQASKDNVPNKIKPINNSFELKWNGVWDYTNWEWHGDNNNRPTTAEAAKERWPDEYYFITSLTDNNKLIVNPFNPQGKNEVPGPTLDEVEKNKFLRADGTWQRPPSGIIVVEDYIEFKRWFTSSGSYMWKDNNTYVIKPARQGKLDYSLLIFVVCDNQWYRCPQNPYEYDADAESKSDADIWGTWQGEAIRDNVPTPIKPINNVFELNWENELPSHEWPVIPTSNVDGDRPSAWRWIDDNPTGTFYYYDLDRAKKEWPKKFYYVSDVTGQNKLIVNPFNPRGNNEVPGPISDDIKKNKFLRADATWQNVRTGIIVLENYYEFYLWFETSGSYRWKATGSSKLDKVARIPDSDYDAIIYVIEDSQWWRCPKNPQEYNSSLTPEEVWGSWGHYTSSSTVSRLDVPSSIKPINNPFEINWTDKVWPNSKENAEKNDWKWASALAEVKIGGETTIESGITGTIVTSGYGYIDATYPLLIIDDGVTWSEDPNNTESKIGSQGAGAKGYAVMVTDKYGTRKRVKNITITDPGAGYTSNTHIYISGYHNARAKVINKTLVLIDGGSGYISEPTTATYGSNSIEINCSLTNGQVTSLNTNQIFVEGDNDHIYTIGRPGFKEIDINEPGKINSLGELTVGNWSELDSNSNYGYPYNIIKNGSEEATNSFNLGLEKDNNLSTAPRLHFTNIVSSIPVKYAIANNKQVSISCNEVKALSSVTISNSAPDNIIVQGSAGQTEHNYSIANKPEGETSYVINPPNDNISQSENINCYKYQNGVEFNSIDKSIPNISNNFADDNADVIIHRDSLFTNAKFGKDRKLILRDDSIVIPAQFESTHHVDVYNTNNGERVATNLPLINSSIDYYKVQYDAGTDDPDGEPCIYLCKDTENSAIFTAYSIRDSHRFVKGEPVKIYQGTEYTKFAPITVENIEEDSSDGTPRYKITFKTCYSSAFDTVTRGAKIIDLLGDEHTGLTLTYHNEDPAYFTCEPLYVNSFINRSIAIDKNMTVPAAGDITIVRVDGSGSSSSSSGSELSNYIGETIATGKYIDNVIVLDNKDGSDFDVESDIYFYNSVALGGIAKGTISSKQCTLLDYNSTVSGSFDIWKLIEIINSDSASKTFKTSYVIKNTQDIIVPDISDFDASYPVYFYPQNTEASAVILKQDVWKVNAITTRESVTISTNTDIVPISTYGQNAVVKYSTSNKIEIKSSGDNFRRTHQSELNLSTYFETGQIITKVNVNKSGNKYGPTQVRFPIQNDKRAFGHITEFSSDGAAKKIEIDYIPSGYITGVSQAIEIDVFDNQKSGKYLVTLTSGTGNGDKLVLTNAENTTGYTKASSVAYVEGCLTQFRIFTDCNTHSIESIAIEDISYSVNSTPTFKVEGYVDETEKLTEMTGGTWDAVACQCSCEVMNGGLIPRYDENNSSYKGNSDDLHFVYTDNKGFCATLELTGTEIVDSATKYVYKPCVISQGSEGLDNLSGLEIKSYTCNYDIVPPKPNSSGIKLIVFTPDRYTNYAALTEKANSIILDPVGVTLSSESTENASSNEKTGSVVNISIIASNSDLFTTEPKIIRIINNETYNSVVAGNGVGNAKNLFPHEYFIMTGYKRADEDGYRFLQFEDNNYRIINPFNRNGNGTVVGPVASEISKNYYLSANGKWSSVIAPGTVALWFGHFTSQNVTSAVELTDNPGWLILAGQTFSIIKYPRLADQIIKIYHIRPSGTTCQLPNLLNRIVVQNGLETGENASDLRKYMLPKYLSTYARIKIAKEGSISEHAHKVYGPGGIDVTIPSLNHAGHTHLYSQTAIDNNNREWWETASAVVAAHTGYKIHLNQTTTVSTQAPVKDQYNNYIFARGVYIIKT